MYYTLYFIIRYFIYTLWKYFIYYELIKCLYPIYMNVIIKQLLILYISWLDNDLRF